MPIEAASLTDVHSISLASPNHVIILWKMSLKPGNQERAWNDPPVFSYDSTQPTVPRRGLLSGRIRHPAPPTQPLPIGSLVPDSSPIEEQPPSNVGGVIILPPKSDTAVPSTCPAVLFPPSGQPTCNVVVASKDDANKETPDLNIDDESMHDKTMEILNHYMKLSSSHMQPRVREDVSKRLSILSTWWTGQKLCSEVRKKVYILAKAMEQEDWDEAHKLHLSLMVDYVSEVSQWMVGIKHIINESRELCSKKPESDN